MGDRVAADGVLERSDHMGLSTELTEPAWSITPVEGLVGHDVMLVGSTKSPHRRPVALPTWTIPLALMRR